MADYTLFLALHPNCSYPYLLDYLQLKGVDVVHSFRLTSSIQRHSEIAALEDRYGQAVLDESLESLERERDAGKMQESIRRVHIGKGLCVLAGEWLDYLAEMYGFERTLILWYADEGWGQSTFTEYQQFIDFQPPIPFQTPVSEWPFGLGPAHISLSLPVPQIVETCSRLPHYTELLNDVADIARKRSHAVCDSMKRQIGTAMQGLQNALEHQASRKIQKIQEYQERCKAVTAALNPSSFQPQATSTESVSTHLASLKNRISALQATMQTHATRISQQSPSRSNPYPVQVCQAKAFGFHLRLIVANYKPSFAYVLYQLEGKEGDERVIPEGIKAGVQTIVLERVLIGRSSLTLSLWSVKGADYVRISPNFSVTVSKTETLPKLLTLPPEMSSEADTSAQSSLDLVSYASSDSSRVEERVWTHSAVQSALWTTATVMPYYQNPVPQPAYINSQLFRPDANTFSPGDLQFPMSTLQPPQIFPHFDPLQP